MSKKQNAVAQDSWQTLVESFINKHHETCFSFITSEKPWKCIDLKRPLHWYCRLNWKRYRLLISEINLTWFFEAWPCRRFGFIFKSIIWVSTWACPSVLPSEIGIEGTLWFWCLSPTTSLYDGPYSLMFSPWSRVCVAGSSKRAGLSPGNYMPNNKKKVLMGISVTASKTTKIYLAKSAKPQLSASKGDILHVFFYLQHEQSYHIANRENFHLPHSKRMLDIQSNKD